MLTVPRAPIKYAGTSLLGPTLAKAATHPETEVKAALRPVLNRHFEFREEVVGVGRKGQKVKIDFWCHPLPWVVNQGWPDRWFGIEAKGYGLQDQRGKAASRLLYQATVYAQSTFPVNGVQIEPDVVLVHPTFARMLFAEREPGVFGDTFDDGFAFALAKTAAMHRVGELLVHPNGDIEVYVHGINRQYSSRWGQSRVDYFGAVDNHASR
jgi:hypothetical protein